jgi:hypothetical protein
VELATAIAVAFARNPMTVALQSNDLHTLSGGRFTLGLGSQIKPHITNRYSMEWSRPAARMRERLPHDPRAPGFIDADLAGGDERVIVGHGRRGTQRIPDAPQPGPSHVLIRPPGRVDGS